MKPSQIKDLLHVYRSDRASGLSETMREAVAAAETDPALHAWVEEEQAFDRAFAAKLREAPAPHDLLPRILAIQEAGPNAAHNHRSAPRSTWAPIVWFGRNSGVAVPAAAALLLFIAVMAITLRPEASVRIDPGVHAFVSAAGTYTGGFENLFMAGDLEELCGYLEASSAPVPRAIPEGLHALSSLGCKKVELEDHTASLISLQGETRYNLFSVERAHFPNQQDLKTPQLRQVGNRAVATWTCRRMIYVLVSEGTVDGLRTHL